jgi:hypothetical protein
MSFNRMAAAAVIVAGLGLAGCSSAGKALGIGSASPDEFRTVARAPLVVPPDYSLRPPSPGEPRPQELQPESAARVALLGESEGQGRSDGEKLLVAKAGADHADPLVRYVVDDEFGEIAHKDRSFADRVMFWRKDNPTGGAGPATDPKLVSAEENAAPIDPVVEAKAVKQLTGDQQVVIARDKRKTSFIKLPGL